MHTTVKIYIINKEQKKRLQKLSFEAPNENTSILLFVNKLKKNMYEG